jgi:rhamnose utilization protein RhaD (predicted bifunctional aldolase and dehydrogenase)/NAD(P)-dependent dehydrogenase (short-subunit alcohol dehydrogenase family)
MRNLWSDADAASFVANYGERWGEDLARRVYLSRLIGAEDSLVLHGGGNNSVKTSFVNILGDRVETILVKASGFDMASIEPEGYTRLDLQYLRRLRALPEMSDEVVANEFGTHLFDAHAAAPSIETPVHVFTPKKFIDHTHADAILALTNQPDGERLVRQALGTEVLVLEYVMPGFKLAQAAAAAFEANPDAKGMVWMRHGLVTWGNTARESYDATIDLVSRAEAFIEKSARRRLVTGVSTPLETARKRLTETAPVVRGLLAKPTGDPDRPHSRVILQPLVTGETLDFVDSEAGKELALQGPLTSDHIIRTKALPLWFDGPVFDDIAKFREKLAWAIRAYSSAYEAYLKRHAARMPNGTVQLDALPRVILVPGMGAFCCGEDVTAARIVKDITAHTLAVKARIAAMGSYLGMEEVDLFDMEYRTLQRAKLSCKTELPLARQVALVTGAAGAIGSGIVQELLLQGCHVAATDLPGGALDSLVQELKGAHGDRVIGVPMDVTDEASVTGCFQEIIRVWGGVDLVIANAGLAHVAALGDLRLESFRKLERVNVEGTLLVLAEAGRHFRLQGTGGDIVLVSTKNVFAPGAKFGAYSATKAAAHQLARIASLELAAIDVRVNMVAPDAVFSNEGRKSGLWAEVGPDRMVARGLDAAGLEEYYRSRNLLKARITARHVAKAVLFFATRQTPTTGSTLPVDGGLPDATPR